MPITSHQVNEGEPTGEGKVAREKSEREGALARPRSEPRQDEMRLPKGQPDPTKSVADKIAERRKKRR